MKNNKYITKVVAGLVGTSIIGSSCTGYILDDYQNVIEANLSDSGDAAIKIELTNEEIDYLSFLNKLGNDILKEPLIAKEFAENPQAYLIKYGYDKNIDIDESLLKLILALGDEDINCSINEGDVKKTILLLKQKGLLDSSLYTNINLSTLNLSARAAEDMMQPAVAFVPIYMVAIAISYAAILYTAAAGVSVYAALGAWTEVAGPRNVEDSTFLDNNPVLKIWQLKGDFEKTHIATDLYIEEEANKLIEVIETYNENAFKGDLTKENFKNFFKLNLLKNNIIY